MDQIREGQIIGMGNPLLDISATTDEGFLKKYGLEPNNAILASDKHRPLNDDLVANYKVEYIAGGSTQNTLRVAQWILKKQNVCVFIGCVGKDKNSEILKSKATEDGVNVQYQYTNERQTGTCSVLITGNGVSRSLVADLSAAECFTKDHLESKEVKRLISQADIYYSSSFFLTVNLETILEVAQIALKRNKLFVFNLSAPFLCTQFNDRMMQVFPYGDIVFGNDEEAKAFASQQTDWDTDDIKEIALKMTRLPKQNSERSRVVVITQGLNPVILADSGKIKEFPVDPIPAEKLVDTNGAGDAFVGGFLAQLVQGEPYDICIKCGIYAAGEIIQRSGTTISGSPSFTK